MQAILSYTDKHFQRFVGLKVIKQDSQMIPKLTIDSSKCITELCELGKEYGTDKSPFNRNTLHRHAQTPVYQMLFAPLKNEPIQFAEIGIAGGSSVLMWRNYFTNATLSFFDQDKDSPAIIENFGIPLTHGQFMDVRDSASIRAGLEAIGHPIDILVDDSSHIVEDIIRIIKTSIPQIKPGGMIIIEDLHRYWDESLFEEGLKDVLSAFSFVQFVDTEHENQQAGDQDNNKMLVLVKH